MRGKRMTWMGWALAAAMLAGTAAMAQGPGDMGMDHGPGFGEHQPPMERAFGPWGDHGRWWNNPRVDERLKLTDAQRKAMDGILLNHREKLIDLRANLEKAELAMEPMISNDRPNETEILAQIDKVAQARAELEKANARFLLAIRAQLTPEQWKLVEQRWGDHRAWRNERQAMRSQRQAMRDWRHDGQQPPAAPPAPNGAQPPAPPVPPAGDAQ